MDWSLTGALSLGASEFALASARANRVVEGRPIRDQIVAY